MKKLLALLMTAALTLTFFTACSSSKKDTNRLEEIKERGYIEVVTEPYFVPNEFIDPTIQGENNVVGMDVEIAKVIAEELGVELRLIPLEFSAVLTGITEAKYDLALSALGWMPSRDESMNLSKGYYFGENQGYGLLIRAEDKDLYTSDLTTIEDAVMVAQSGSMQEYFINDQIEKHGEFKRVSSTTDGYLMIAENKADVMAVAIANAELYMEANPEDNLMIIDGFRFEVDESVAGTRAGMPKGEDELTEFVDGVLQELLESGQTEAWYQEYSEYATSLGLE